VAKKEPESQQMDDCDREMEADAQCYFASNHILCPDIGKNQECQDEKDPEPETAGI
jgi:hypothetical protein